MPAIRLAAHLAAVIVFWYQYNAVPQAAGQAPAASQRTVDAGAPAASEHVPSSSQPQDPAAQAAAAAAATSQAAKNSGSKDPSKTDEKEKDGKDAAAKSVQRNSAPPEPPNPDELKVRPNEKGLVEFQFRNQPWPDLLKWLAEVSQVSLDWQELPGDYLNLTTQRPHSIEETRDAINRHLLMRGFTMLESEGVVSVVKIASINPSMVPRVEPSALAMQPPHRFVRSSFELAFLLAADVHEEFKSMLSPNGKITPLVATNRLEVMDAAANLNDIHRVLDQEQSLAAIADLAREFPLKHARSTFVKEQLEIFLGLKKPSSSSQGGGMENMQQIQQQMQQQMQQMQQQQQQGGAAGKLPAQKAEIYLVANDRNNSVIVHAPQNKMAIVASFIERMDVPNNQAADFERIGIRMKVFRLASLQPSELVKSLLAMDVLEPSTKLQVDENNQAIIAYASIADQYMIQSIIDRLDGSQRSANVIQLRRLDAEAVAGSIKFLMGAEDEKKEESSSRYSYFDFYSPRSSSSKKTDKMRVGANVQDNQVLVWANEIEMEEVRGLLVKLGELPPPGGRASTMRVIDASRQPETYEYLKRLKEQFEQMSPNSIVIPEASEFEETKIETQEAKPPSKALKPKPEVTQAAPNRVESKDNSTLISISDDPTTTQTSADTKNSNAPNQLVNEDDQVVVPPANRRTFEPLGRRRVTENDDESSPDPQSRGQLLSDRQLTPAKIVIQVDESGRLILQSSDPAALDRLEEMMQLNKPPQRPYDKFFVKFARASWVKLNLDEYFEKEKKRDDRNDRFYSWMYGMPTEDKKDTSRQLGKKDVLRFIADNDTSSIIAIGANDMDRRTIKELIELWDVPEPTNGKDVRYTKLVQIKHSNAESIVNTIKEAYKDLLSANDAALQTNQGGGGKGGNRENKRESNQETVQADGGLSSNFKGELSLGADVITNSVLVSARGEPLLELVVDMIKKLDVAAAPQGNVEVVQLSPGMAKGSLADALRAMLDKGDRQGNGPTNRGRQNGQDNGQEGGQENRQTGSSNNAQKNRGR